MLVGVDVLLQGYTASYAGVPAYQASSAHGDIGLTLLMRLQQLPWCGARTGVTAC